LLHGPTQRSGLAADDWSAWWAMEAIYHSGKARLIGISNVNLQQLQELVGKAKVKPAFVQNRCYASRGWDRGAREFCAASGIVYQGFSLLTANSDALSHPDLRKIAKSHGKSPSQIVFRFALDVGMLPLTGTTNASHMRADLEVAGIALEPNEISTIEELVTNSQP
jgi:diketogulonate reductase-like aldo/keto reductase